jgi:hypothetical protein
MRGGDGVLGGKRARNGEGRKKEVGGTSVLKGEGEGGTWNVAIQRH